MGIKFVSLSRGEYQLQPPAPQIASHRRGNILLKKTSTSSDVFSSIDIMTPFVLGLQHFAGLSYKLRCQSIKGLPLKYTLITKKHLFLLQRVRMNIVSFITTKKTGSTETFLDKVFTPESHSLPSS